LPGRGFRLERLLRIVRLREDGYLLNLAVARRAEAEAQNRVAAAREANERLISAMREAAGQIDPLRMVLGWAAMDAAEGELADAAAWWRERQACTVQARSELTETSRGRKSLEHLRQKHLARQLLEWNREQYRLADEHATVQRTSREVDG
jgi:hypothetical protein